MRSKGVFSRGTSTITVELASRKGREVDDKTAVGRRLLQQRQNIRSQDIAQAEHSRALMNPEATLVEVDAEWPLDDVPAKWGLGGASLVSETDLEPVPGDLQVSGARGDESPGPALLKNLALPRNIESLYQQLADANNKILQLTDRAEAAEREAQLLQPPRWKQRSPEQQRQQRRKRRQQRQHGNKGTEAPTEEPTEEPTSAPTEAPPPVPAPPPGAPASYGKACQQWMDTITEQTGGDFQKTMEAMIKGKCKGKCVKGKEGTPLKYADTCSKGKCIANGTYIEGYRAGECCSPLEEKMMFSDGNDVYLRLGYRHDKARAGYEQKSKFVVAFKAGCVTAKTFVHLGRFSKETQVCGCKETTGPLVNGWSLAADSDTYTYQEIYGMREPKDYYENHKEKHVNRRRKMEHPPHYSTKYGEQEYVEGPAMLDKWEMLMF